MSAPADPKPPGAETLEVFDAHVDSLQLALDLGRDLGQEGAGHLDLVRARRGGVGALVFVCWVDPVWIAPERGGARARTESLLRELHHLLARHPEQVSFAGDGVALEAARAAGRIAAIGGIEGGHSIEARLDLLETFFEHGVRVMTLVWNNHLPWIRSCRDGADADVPAGLSDFGREVVRRMNALGMLVDLSHAGERSFYDTLEVSSKAVIASHSGCQALHDHPRNLTDAQLRSLAERDGVVGIVFCPPFLDAAVRADEGRVRASAEYNAIEGPNETALQLARARHMQRVARPLPLERVLDHVCHAASVAGVEHVGIGSDFDGIDHAPQGLEDASCYPRLAEGLARRGFADAELRAILGGNMRRVFAAATGPGTRAARAPLVPFAAASPS